MSDSDESGGAADSDYEGDGAMFRGLDTSSSESEDEDRGTAEHGGGKQAEPTQPPFDAGFLLGWHRPTTDRGPLRGLTAMSDADSTPRRCGDALKSDCLTPRALFRLYWDDELLDRMLAATNSSLGKIARSTPPPVTKSELIRFVALSVAMGINKQPQVAHYWRQDTFGTPSLFVLHLSHRLWPVQVWAWLELME